MSCLPSWQIIFAEACSIAILQDAPGFLWISAIPTRWSKKGEGAFLIQLLCPICSLTRGRTASLSYLAKWSSCSLSLTKNKFLHFCYTLLSQNNRCILRPDCRHRRVDKQALDLCYASPPSSKSRKEEKLTLLYLSLIWKKPPWVDFVIAGGTEMV